MHERKKGGQRRDKKSERMHKDIAERKAKHKERPTPDQHDIIDYKPGGPSDANRHD